MVGYDEISLSQSFVALKGYVDAIQLVMIVSSRTWSLTGCCCAGVLVRVHVLHMESNV